ncbi:hypothetical protein PCE1_004550 [Barthelona sp. PCE]
MWLKVYFRLLVKFVLHIVTGKSQISRIVQKPFKPELNISMITSLSASKRLREHHEKFVSGGIDVEEFFNIIVDVKSVHNDHHETLLRYLTSYSSIKSISNDLLTTMKTGFDANDNNHMRYLDTMYTVLFDRKKPDDEDLVVNVNWTTVGFQQPKITSDFRGAGVLGITFMDYMATFQAARFKKLAKNIPLFGIVVINLVCEFNDRLQSGDLNLMLLRALHTSKDTLNSEFVFRIWGRLVAEFWTIYEKEIGDITQFEMSKKPIIERVILDQI